jgi:hypothetical protein
MTTAVTQGLVNNRDQKQIQCKTDNICRHGTDTGRKDARNVCRSRKIRSGSAVPHPAGKGHTDNIRINTQSGKQSNDQTLGFHGPVSNINDDQSRKKRQQ